MSKIEEWFGITGVDLNNYLLDFGIAILSCAAILIIGFWLANKIISTVSKMLAKSNMDPALTSFLASVARAALKIFVVLAAVGQLGIQMTSFIALIGAAGLAVGMAFSGALSNFAGGVMILFFKPFKVDDFVEAQGEMGFVKEMHIFNTVILAMDNRTVLLPNGPLANGNIVNYSQEGIRRIDLEFGFNYGGDYDKVKKVLENIMANDTRILKTPAPFIGLGGLGDSSVNVTVRPWCTVADYWAVHFDMHEKVYKEFAANDIAIPFPQMDVHVIKE